MTVVSDRASLAPVALGLSAVLIPALAALVVARLSVSSSSLLMLGLVVLLMGLLHNKLTIYLIIFSMLLSPEWGVGALAGYRPVTIRFEDILLILVGVAWLARSAYHKELGLFRNSPLNGPIAAYSAVAVFATVISGWTHEINWLRALLFLAKYLEYFVLYFLVLNNLKSRSDVRNYLIAALLTCAVVSVVCISQIPDGGRVTAPFEGEDGEPNTLGGYLVFMLALASVFYFTASSTREHRLAYTFGQPPEPGQIRVGATRLDTSLSARIRSWEYGLEGWAQKPLTGHGVAGYGFMDAQYVRILTETGLLGLAAFSWLAINIFRMVRRRLRNAKDRFATALCLGYLAGFVAMLVHGIGANTFIIVRIMEPFWLVTALVAALPGDEPPSAERGPARGWVSLRVGAPQHERAKKEVSAGS